MLGLDRDYMRGLLILPWIVVLGGMPAAADVCGRADIYGAYGFQLTGTTTIGALGPQAEAAVGRLVFDGDGGVSGVASVNLNGYFLGNPVTGSYTFKTNCDLTFELQDDSGAFQHFEGLVRPGGNSAEIHQTDPGAGGRGVLERTPSTCDDTSLKGSFALALSGTASQFATDEAPGAAFAVSGTLDADGAGNLALTTASGKTTGSYDVDSDCVAEVQLGVAVGGSASIIKLRGVVVKDGKLVLAVESDPEHTASARLTAKP